MSLSRRHFLEAGLVSAAGLLLPLQLAAAPGLDSGESAGPVYFLPTGSMFDEVFAAGLGGSACRTDFCPIDLRLSMLLNWDRLLVSLAQFEGTRLVGIMEEQRYAVFEEALREARAAVLCTGHHVGDALARHHFVSLPDSQGVGETLAQALAARGETVLVEERPVHEAIAVYGKSSVLPLTQSAWQSMTAEMLGQVASGNWRITTVRAAGFDAAMADAIAGRSGSLAQARHVSFAVQL